MTTMIERVARAMAKAASPLPWEMGDEEWRNDFRTKARAAIEAMREPDEAMLDAGVNFRERNARTEQIWQAMVDEALKEKQ
jgi:hypothetical protein